MKVVGIALTILGGLMVLSGLNLAFTKYDLNSSHDQSKFFGSFGLSALVVVAGIILIKKSSSNR
jgi:hypothetical protein